MSPGSSPASPHRLCHDSLHVRDRLGVSELVDGRALGVLGLERGSQPEMCQLSKYRVGPTSRSPERNTRSPGRL